MESYPVQRLIIDPLSRATKQRMSTLWCGLLNLAGRQLEVGDAVSDVADLLHA